MAQHPSPVGDLHKKITEGVGSLDELKALLLGGDVQFWGLLRQFTETTSDFDQLIRLSTVRRRAHARQLAPDIKLRTVRVALVGGYSFYPLRDILEHLCEMGGLRLEIWQGAYDNYVNEIMDERSDLYRPAPAVVIIMPSELRCHYTGLLTDALEAQKREAERTVEELLALGRKVHETSKAEIILTNFRLPARHDLGGYRSRTLGCDWNFRKWVNLELGLKAPPFLHICDWEFLAHRIGGLNASDDRAWYESKQAGSAALLAQTAGEMTRLISALWKAPKKVLVMDLDNTLWGGVVADDGLEGIEIGDTSPRGEAFKAFQRYIISLKQRGVLLAVCSKNDHHRAVEAFEKHPEMVLRMKDIVSFKANWDPKAENIRQIAAELNVGLDSLVFIDDNPAEIAIVNQFVPEVSTILLSADPAEYKGQLQDCRYFEPQSITKEDAERTAQYQSEADRRVLLDSVTNMDSYLESLAMEAEFNEFRALDVPRLSQLINKSNQFNLTTRRRTEAEVETLIDAPGHACFSVRLKDRFGDHGLVSIVIGEQTGQTMKIDTWLMSCRVLKRQVEDEVLSELVRIASHRKCTRLEACYLPTAKNEMVRDFYSLMGFTLLRETAEMREFELTIADFQVLQTKIKIARRAYEPN